MPAGKIIRVAPDSLAAEIGLVAGDKILSVNGQDLRDIIDLSFALAEEEIDLLIEHADGAQELISFDKDMDEELGAEFSSAVFDGIKRCANNCAFCFVNMVAPHMRHSLSVKDDDYRLSFLYGNFITLTNMGEADFRRIAKFHLSPLYVSIQCMNPELRAKLLRQPRAAKISEQLDRLEAAGAFYHTQVVLCAGLNDGAELERTIRELVERRPQVLSLAIVPVGITKHRRDPFPLRQFDQAGAAAVIDEAEKWQAKLRQETGRTFLYLGDEFYFLAGRPLPPAAYYDGFPQLDNGIGLTRSFIEDFEATAAGQLAYPEPVYLDIIAGTSVAPVLAHLAHSVKHPQLHARIVPVANDYFGATVNVSGLLTGQDILRALEQLSGKRTGILLPASALRAGEDIFLDDMRLAHLQEKFPQARIETVQGGADYKKALTDWDNYHAARATEAAYMWQSNAAYTKPA